MHSWIHLIFIMFFIKNKCSYIINNRKTDQISNNIGMLVKPIKILTGIFPNHEFEVQFNLEHVDYDRPSKQINNENPSYAIMRTKTATKETTTKQQESVEESAPVSQETTMDPDNPIVHMKDLKKALEEFEKKYSTGDCVKKDLTTESTNLLSTFHDNPALSDVLQLIKRGAKLQHDIPNTGDSDMSWLKIKVPTA